MTSSPNKDQYANRYIEWLKSAHNSSVLLVSKNKFSKNLGRKLRPELSKMFTSSSTSDALWLIEKYNSNPDVPGIDAVIMDADTSALKLVENINKRAIDRKTCQFPVIATILLIPYNVDTDYMNILNSVGGATACLSFPGTTKKIFERVLETIYQFKMIESTYKDLSKVRQTKQFPFLPLFQSSEHHDNTDHNYADDDDDDDEDDEDDNVSNGEDNQSNDKSEGKYREGDLGSDGEVDSVENWTYSSSMLPGFVKDLRNETASKFKNESYKNWKTLPGI